MLTRILTTALLGAGLLASSALAGGHENTPPEIKARNGLMANYSYNLSILGAMAKGETEYNAEVAAIAAANLAAVTGTDQSLLWTAGTDNAAMQGKTRATPKIWEDSAGFQKASADMAAAAKAMADVAGTDLASLQGAMGAVGGACGTCHKAYRGPKPE
ncbi:cytochrome c556 [Litoreibacter ponti]|uniref:Cytochrome c556 n=1 Tax=Litoreibacter ponti TaxID=1510457 RepID=A0A2T6BIB5_9RHOB|nr:cytochrome c [Litoreibacter ponti]PTX55801.1 cytochrome c556 [Litoreibacter ponti]